MPSSIIHRCVSKRVLEKSNLFLNEKDLYLYDVGSIAPDSWRNSKRFKDSPLHKKDKRKYSHFSNDGEYLERYDRFYDKYKQYLDNPFMVGYFVHLLTDVRWRDTMFYKCFDENGSIKLLDGSTINGEKGVRKSLLDQESKTMAYLLNAHFNLSDLRTLTSEELDALPVMEEIEFDGVNDTIRYTNSEAKKNTGHELVVYKVDDFALGIEQCSDYIIDKLKEYDVIRHKKGN